MIVEWTDAQIMRLKELWAKGFSHSQVAAELDCGFTRSAIAGKIMRLKLPPRDKRRPTPRPRAVALKASPLPRRNQTNSLAEKIAIAEAEPGLPERLKGEKPDGTGIQIGGLTALNCHFPLGDPLEPDFEFCGRSALEGFPYCSRHCRISFVSASDRRSTSHG